MPAGLPYPGTGINAQRVHARQKRLIKSKGTEIEDDGCNISRY